MLVVDMKAFRQFGVLVSATGVVPGASNGLHGSQCADERRRARLLPGDEKPMRPDGYVGITRLLPENSGERSR